MSVSSKKGFDPTFENGGFWDYYKDLEHQFEDFLKYVPYLEGNEETYSYRLANIILAIGAHIDSAFKEITKYALFSTKYPKMLNPVYEKGVKKGKPRRQNISDYYPISEEYNLPQEIVKFKCLPQRKEIVPFKEYQRITKKVPYWWTAYNKIKHNFNENFKMANLRTARDALAGAFLLNVIHIPSIDRLLSFGLLKARYGPKGYELIYDKFRGKEMHPGYSPSDVKDPYFIETELFVYDYQKPIKP